MACYARLCNFTVPVTRSHTTVHWVREMFAVNLCLENDIVGKRYERICSYTNISRCHPTLLRVDSISMAPYPWDIYVKEMREKYSCYGTALWNPSPHFGVSEGNVEIGDVAGRILVRG